MKSPVGVRKPLHKICIEEGLFAFQCQQSQGIYIPLELYWNWLRKQGDKLAQLPIADMADTDVPVVDVDTVKLCPETSTLMMRYQVGHGFDFYIDRSRTGGVWLDAGEWEALKSRNFHDELHLVFTAPWQKNRRDEQIDEATKVRQVERFGVELLSELDALKLKLLDHPHRDYAIAYLDR